LYGRRATEVTPATSAAETPATARTTAGAPSREIYEQICKKCMEFTEDIFKVTFVRSEKKKFSCLKWYSMYMYVAFCK
jgi:hypothetical protein